MIVYFNWTLYSAALPEIVLAVSILALLLIGAFCPEKLAPKVVGRLSIAALLATLGSLIYTWDTVPFGFAFPRVLDNAPYSAMFILDGFGYFVKGFILIATMFCVFIAKDYLERMKLMKFEYFILLLLTVLGSMVMVSAHDLLIFYIGLEMMSFSLYILTAYNRNNVKSSEAGLKYFVLGSLASAMMLYGMSLLYGMAGTTSFAALQDSINLIMNAPGGVTDGTFVTICVALVLLIVGMAFKISAVPFHMWTPDVYEGAPRSVTAFMAVVPKIAAVAIFIRVLHEPLFFMAQQWQQVLVAVALLTMFVGSFMAIMQTNLKRLIAYSSIVHVGFILVPMVTGTVNGISAILFYLVMYTIMSIGIFAVFMAVRNRDGFAQNIEDLAGLSKQKPLVAAAMALFMFSLAGIPPLAGFTAKFVAFKEAVDSGYIWLAIFAVLCSVVAAFYCLRIVKIMYFDEAKNNWNSDVPLQISVIIAVMALGVVGFGLFPDTISDAVRYAAENLYTGAVIRG